MNNYLNNLNEAQLKATLQTDGPMIVIAGAGSGKTRVLTYKIAYLMTRYRSFQHFSIDFYK